MLNKLFCLEDKILKMRGLYSLWTMIYISNIVVLAVDRTTGASRDFNMWSNGVSVLYCGITNFNNIYGNQMPSSAMLIAGSIHQYLFWQLFTYYGSNDVLGSHPIGVMNTICTVLCTMFTLDMIVKSWVLTLNPVKYLNYVHPQNKKSTEVEIINEVQQDNKVEKINTIVQQTNDETV